MKKRKRGDSALILDLACKKVSIESGVEKVWAARMDKESVTCLI